MIWMKKNKDGIIVQEKNQMCLDFEKDKSRKKRRRARHQTPVKAIFGGGRVEGVHSLA